MEKISIHNYEAFYLDYLEGNLDEIGQSMLFNFLDNNLALKIELEDDVLDFTLSPNTETLTKFDKEDLKHFECLEDEICLANVSDFMILDLENEITFEKKKELTTFVLEHHLEKDEKYFHATKLSPNLAEVYDDKAGLKKKGTVIPLVIKIASIAAIGLLLFNFMGSTEAEYYAPRHSTFALQIDTLNHKFEINLADNNTVETLNLKDSHIEKNNSNSKEKLPKYTEVKKDSIQPMIQDLPNPNEAIVIEKFIPIAKDSSLIPLVNETPNFNEDIVQANTPIEEINNGIKLVDMYKPIINLTNSYTNLDVSFKKSTKDNEYQVTNIKFGKFSFERKKRK